MTEPLEEEGHDPSKPIEIVDLVLSRKGARELAQKTHAETGQVVTVRFQGGVEIAGRELTDKEARDARRCPACRSLRIRVQGENEIACIWCGWRGDPDAYVRPSLHLKNPTLRPVDYDPEPDR